MPRKVPHMNARKTLIVGGFYKESATMAFPPQIINRELLGSMIVNSYYSRSAENGGSHLPLINFNKLCPVKSMGAYFIGYYYTFARV